MRSSKKARTNRSSAVANAVARKRGRTPPARIMREFGHRPVTSITSSDVNRFLARLDAEPSIGPPTVNKHRQVASPRGHARGGSGATASR